MHQINLLCPNPPNKLCSICNEYLPATSEEFVVDKRNKSGLDSRCRVCRRAEQRSVYSETSREYLRRLYNNIKQRCKNQRSYIAKGIECKFESVEDFTDYVIYVLQVSPRGLDCHRINDAGHYKRGNIEFITFARHRKIHIKLRKEASCKG